MPKISQIKNIFTVCFLIISFFVPSLNIEAMTTSSDKLSLSWPGTPSNHTITFRVVDNLPPNSRISIVPQSGHFFIPPTFDYDDIDLSTSDALNGFYIDRNISSTSGPGLDTVTVAASSTNGYIDIVLSPDAGIDSGTYVKIELGSNADFGETGSDQILNPNAIGSYSIDVKSYDDNGNYLERAIIMIAVVQPVRTGNTVLKSRSNGTPKGVLNFGTTQAIMSLMTNYEANCRWSRTASTSYYMMTDIFAYTGGFYHSSIITGITNGTYYYYIRCLDTVNNEADTTDYVISFLIAGFAGQGGDQDVEGSPGSGGGAGPGTGKGTGGGTGSGAGTGIGLAMPFPPLPSDPAVSFQGYAYPSSKVVLLKDGVEDQTVTAGANGSFDIDIMELPQGVYTFGIYSEDKSSRKSVTKSLTFYIKEGTKTQLYNLFLSPTIDVPVTSFNIGDEVRVLGQSAANADIELLFYPKSEGDIASSSIIKQNGKSGANGEWNFSLATDKLVNGPYQIKARATLSAAGTSDFSKIIDLMAGGEVPKQSTCSGGDLNGDGKVNITDFSILLYWWNKKNDCADLNHDGTVNLIDFSIMMYNWTG